MGLVESVGAGGWYSRCSCGRRGGRAGGTALREQCISGRPGLAVAIEPGRCTHREVSTVFGTGRVALAFRAWAWIDRPLIDAKGGLAGANSSEQNVAGSKLDVGDLVGAVVVPGGSHLRYHCPGACHMVRTVDIVVRAPVVLPHYGHPVDAVPRLQVNSEPHLGPDDGGR